MSYKPECPDCGALLGRLHKQNCPRVQPLPIPKNARITAPPSRVVGMCEFQGQVIVACEGGVYRLDRGELVPIPFAAPTSN